MKDITKKISNRPAQKAHVNEAPKEVNPMKDVLEHPKELSEAVNLPKKVWKDKKRTSIRISSKFTAIQTKKDPDTFTSKLSTLCSSTPLSKTTLKVLLLFQKWPFIDSMQLLCKIYWKENCQ
ncbi:hypothetical protein O181_086435 [Austropuccinia psidii MF-1]|uniref:Uncharacterized protein n=1 Tax=Austropuccinia psidii MF-1 TaxID=1389203 RepID=A0A9Q3FU79_9BASI|nr:hypothetical protein [Austropuccinia psidii MF-1]